MFAKHVAFVHFHLQTAQAYILSICILYKYLKRKANITKSMKSKCSSHTISSTKINLTALALRLSWSMRVYLSPTPLVNWFCFCFDGWIFKLSGFHYFTSLHPSTFYFLSLYMHHLSFSISPIFSLISNISHHPTSTTLSSMDSKSWKDILVFMKRYIPLCFSYSLPFHGWFSKATLSSHQFKIEHSCPTIFDSNK